MLGTFAELAPELAERFHLFRSRSGVGELVQDVYEGACHPRVRTVGRVGRDVGDRVPRTDEQPVVTDSIAERVAPEPLVRALACQVHRSVDSRPPAVDARQRDA